MAGDRGGLRRPRRGRRSGVCQFLRQDSLQDAASHGPSSLCHEGLGGGDLHRRRGVQQLPRLPTVTTATTSSLATTTSAQGGNCTAEILKQNNAFGRVLFLQITSERSFFFV